MQTEINGTKFEIQDQIAVRTETLRVGDRVSVLLKPTYGEKKVCPGVVVGFEPFPSSPTIQVAYIESTYTDADIKFLAFNESTKDAELVKAMEGAGALDKEKALRMLGSKVERARRELRDAEDRMAYFDRNFAAYWQPVEVNP